MQIGRCVLISLALGCAAGMDTSGPTNPCAPLLDTDGDGVADAVDRNANGVADTLNGQPLRLVDVNGDDMPDAIDTNRDGLPDLDLPSTPRCGEAET